MLSEGAPEMAADIPDDANKRLPQAKVCKKCSTSNPSDNDYCGNCGRLLASCPNCGHTPEEGMPFCTKCGHPLN
jgi:ribosomal protein L40E